LLSYDGDVILNSGENYIMPVGQMYAVVESAVAWRENLFYGIKEEGFTVVELYDKNGTLAPFSKSVYRCLGIKEDYLFAITKDDSDKYYFSTIYTATATIINEVQINSQYKDHLQIDIDVCYSYDSVADILVHVYYNITDKTPIADENEYYVLFSDESIIVIPCPVDAVVCIFSDTFATICIIEAKDDYEEQKYAVVNLKTDKMTDYIFDWNHDPDRKGAGKQNGKFVIMRKDEKDYKIDYDLNITEFDGDWEAFYADGYN